MKKPVSILVFPLAFLSAGPALAQSMCVVEGNRPIMGANMNAAFDVQAGQGCMSDISPQGTLTTSEISQRPQHGTLSMVDKDTWTYTAAPGYSGPDAFAITASGQSVDQKPGTSVLNYKVTIK
ncbi:Ig-like domain-containing protein [Microvirga rosea]|uniref:Ig-like domain-containing protein n=1 Tax=Microvirga rosea TaxID=2715425 RepID=UPI001D0B9FFE|nr:Ig-like domain-containing protein [Microvirga rosea]MCB8819928.1 Ig-like domain-containing protein [Microvirga rosea]